MWIFGNTEDSMMTKSCKKRIFLVRIRRFFLISDTIDILCLVYSNFSAKKNIYGLKIYVYGLEIFLIRAENRLDKA